MRACTLICGALPPSSPDYDADAADVMEERLTRWLGEVSLV